MSPEIETGIPLPTRQAPTRVSRYPYGQMEVGQSFFVPNGEDEPDVVLRRMRQGAMWAKVRYSPARFTARQVEGGTRVWRVE
jgi:hypothetical protein